MWPPQAWMPGMQRYGEISSASNCTDYQARRLGCVERSPEAHLLFASTFGVQCYPMPNSQSGRNAGPWHAALSPRLLHVTAVLPAVLKMPCVLCTAGFASDRKRLSQKQTLPMARSQRSNARCESLGQWKVLNLVV